MDAECVVLLRLCFYVHLIFVRLNITRKLSDGYDRILHTRLRVKTIAQKASVRNEVGGLVTVHSTGSRGTGFPLQRQVCLPQRIDFANLTAIGAYLPSGRLLWRRRLAKVA